MRFPKPKKYLMIVAKLFSPLYPQVFSTFAQNTIFLKVFIHILDCVGERERIEFYADLLTCFHFPEKISLKELMSPLHVTSFPIRQAVKILSTYVEEIIKIRVSKMLF